MKKWVRFELYGREQIGLLEDGVVRACRGDLFGRIEITATRAPLDSIKLLPPVNPGKIIGLWNNFHARADKEGWDRPPHPLYFMKTPGGLLGSGQVIPRPLAYAGAVFFEGELGIVIGEPCVNITPEQADEYILGYTCVNDVTAKDILFSDPSFPQWTRAKGFDGFCPVGPCLVTDASPDDWIVRTLVDGVEQQNYPVSDMFFSPREIVAHLSNDMTLAPGDVIACGTSLGAGEMPDGCQVEVVIEPIGALVNPFAGRRRG